MNHFACARCPYEAAAFFWHCQCGWHESVSQAHCGECGGPSPMHARAVAREARANKPRRRVRYTSQFGWAQRWEQ